MGLFLAVVCAIFIVLVALAGDRIGIAIETWWEKRNG